VLFVQNLCTLLDCCSEFSPCGDFGFKLSALGDGWEVGSVVEFGTKAVDLFGSSVLHCGTYMDCICSGTSRRCSARLGDGELGHLVLSVALLKLFLGSFNHAARHIVMRLPCREHGMQQ